ncbi:MAG TPA: hypothetical protein VIU61_03100 [Kofleriaceae bacterium]
MTFPFRFYGREPTEWHTSVEQPYRLRFVEPLDEVARLQIAGVIAPVFAEGRVLPGTTPWRWAGDRAVMTVCDPANERAWLDAVEELLRAVHSVAPLQEVVFEGAQGDGNHAWDDWTLRQSRTPYPVDDRVPMADPTFDRALAAALDDSRAAVAHRDHAAAEARAARLSLTSRPTDRWPELANEPIDPATHAMLSEGKEIERWLVRDGVVVALYKSGLRYIGVNGKARMKATRSHGNRAWLAPGGSHVIVENGIDLLRLTLPEGVATTFPKPIPGFQLAPHEVAHDQLAVRTLSGVMLVHETEGGLEVASEVELAGFDRLVPACAGRLLLVVRWGEAEVLAVGPGSLRSVGAIPFTIMDVRGSATELVFREPNGIREVTNLATLFDESSPPT